MSEKYKKLCKNLNFTKHFNIFVSVVTGFLLISAFASLVGVTIGITKR